MLKVKLKNELKSLKDSNSNQADLIINEVKQLMEGTLLEEREILKTMGLGSNLLKAEEQTRKSEEIKMVENEYEGDVYSREQIKHLAMKYNLKFLNTRYFSGTISPDTGAVLARFKKKHVLTDYDLKDNFFILAPKRMFKLVERPVDPLLFYRVRNNKNRDDHYKLVHKWGNDFSVARQISGFLNKSEETILFKHLAGIWLAATVLIQSFNLTAKLMGIALWSSDRLVSNWVFGSFIVITWILAGMFSVAAIYTYFERDFRHLKTSNSWDVEFSN